MSPEALAKQTIPADTHSWHDAGPLDDLPDGDVWPAVIAGREVALFRLGDEAFATDVMCTHGAGRLCDGFVEDGQVECPLHQGRFDIRTGAPCSAPVTDAVRTYPVRVDAGRVLVQVPD